MMSLVGLRAIAGKATNRNRELRIQLVKLPALEAMS